MVLCLYTVNCNAIVKVHTFRNLNHLCSSTCMRCLCIKETISAKTVAGISLKTECIYLHPVPKNMKLYLIAVSILCHSVTETETIFTNFYNINTICSKHVFGKTLLTV